MKKTYFVPTMMVVKMQHQHLLAGSETINQNGNYGDGSGITLGSRGYDFGSDGEE